MIIYRYNNIEGDNNEGGIVGCGIFLGIFSAVYASRHNIYCEKCSEKRQAQGYHPKCENNVQAGGYLLSVK